MAAGLGVAGLAERILVIEVLGWFVAMGSLAMRRPSRSPAKAYKGPAMEGLICAWRSRDGPTTKLCARCGTSSDGGGSCTKGTCEGTDVAGTASSRACAVCLLPPSDECTADNVGKPCDGGVCISDDGKALGPAGAGPSSQVVYPQWTCQIVIDASGPLAELDASVRVPHGGAGSRVASRRRGRRRANREKARRCAPP